MPHADRTCPYCEKDFVCSVKEADMVFQTSDWGATSMLADAELVCSYCHAVRIDGEWDRMETVDSRAWKLSQSGGTKSVGDYKDILTSGEPEPQRPTADAEDW